MPVQHSTVTPTPLPPGVTPVPAAVPPGALTPFQDDLPVPPVLRLDRTHDPASCRIVLRNKLVRLHAAFPAPVTPVWSYDVWDDRHGHWLCEGRYLGPTLQVHRGRPATVTYENALSGFLPIDALVMTPGAAADPQADPLTANLPGPVFGAGASPDASAAPAPGTQDTQGQPHLYAWTVTHLHGGRTAAMYDGWTENCMLPPRTEANEGGAQTLPGGTQVSVYENNQNAAMLWYHDHGMGVTRLNVASGLAGVYLIRDANDPADGQKGAQGVTLPSGIHEVPLVIQDRNLATDSAGNLTGRLLHKVTDGTAEYFAPYTLVNGVIWPKKSVERRPYRLRMLNASNARAYCLKWVTLDAQDAITGQLDWNAVARQIGSDGGLLHAPVPLPDGSQPPPAPNPNPQQLAFPDGLFLASAERADLYVDFSRVPAGVARVALVNTAFAPFHRATVDHPDRNPNPNQQETDPTTGQPAPAGAPGDARPGMRLPHPFVMRFDLDPAQDTATVTDLIASPLTLDPDLQPLTHADLPDAPIPHGHRVIALVENPPGMLMMYELAEFTPGQASQFLPLKASGTITIQDTSGSTVYVPLSARFEDQVNIFVPYGRWEVWKILNLTVDTHPFHVHLVQFRVLERRLFNTSSVDPILGGTAAFQQDWIVDENEQGWKDVVRVNPGEMVSIAARFDGFTGRYMYHCHILEHEDHDMMRPFVVTPPPVMDAMPDMPMLDGSEGMKMGGMGGMG